MISPNSRIIILKTPMELDDKNQITFASATAQYNYFYNLTKRELDNATFVRKDNVVRFETDEDFTYDDVLLYNYCMYQNTSYGDKWFYAYIVKVEYKSDGMSELTLKTDVYQTWCFQALWRESFIEREHIAKADDIIGVNTIPENLETGEYIYITNGYSNFGASHLVMSSTISLADGSATGGTVIDGLYSGTFYFSFKTESDLNNAIKQIDRWGKSNAIQCIFYALDVLTGYNSLSWNTHTGDYTYDYASLSNLSPSAKQLATHNIGRVEDFEGFVPKNNKLFTFPYCYMQLTNNVGNNAIYRYEDFTDINNIQFYSFGVLCPSNSIITYPIDSKECSVEGGIMFGKLPIVNWQTDVYTNWLTQNAVNIPVNIIGGASSIIAGISSNSGAGISGGLSNIANTLGQIYEHSLVPPQAQGNSNGGDVIFSNGDLEFRWCHKHIKKQFAQVIDDYFSMYGYATHRVKLPNLSNRSNWNYVKTINANIIGSLPQEDLSEFRKLFDEGITLWHTTTDFLDYSKANN